MTEQLAVTGIGTVDASGFDVEDLARDLELGVHRVRCLPGEPSRFARWIDNSRLSEELPRGAARRMSRPSQFAVVAARRALADSGFAQPSLSGSTSVVVATTFGPLAYTEKLLDQMQDEGPTAASPALFTECVANAPAAQVSIATSAEGANIAISQREAGPLVALGVGCAEISAGRADRVLVGCTDEVTGVLHRVLSRFGALTDSQGNGKTPQPFGPERDGFLLSEGATILHCEKLVAAQERGIRLIAVVAACGGAFDPTASRAGWGQGSDALANSMIRWFAREGIDPDSIDLIVSGASGSVQGDRVEGQMLRRVWNGNAMPSIVAPKAVTGEYGGGFLAAAVLAVQGKGLPRSVPTGTDPSIGVHLQATADSVRPKRVLVTTCAAGGAVAWVVLEAPR